MSKSIDEIKKQVAELNERQKELKCLYNVNTILKEEHLSLEEILLNIALEIPNGYRFPGCCQSMILIHGKEIRPPGLIITDFRHSSKIRLQDSEIGEINVYYSKPVELHNGQVFLNEEQKLIDTIAESISHYITLQHFREVMRDNQAMNVAQKAGPAFEKWLSDLYLSTDQSASLLSARINFRKGELILKQGTHSSYVVLFAEGLAKAYVEDLNQRSVTFKIIKPFDFIGLSSLFGNTSNGFSVSAVVSSSGYIIRKDIIQTIVEQNPRFNLQIFEWYGKNFDLLYHRLNMLGNKQALGRIADSLLYLWEEVSDHGIIASSITRKIIAELSGMSNENGVRILSELKAEEIIATGKGGIEILKPDKLRTYIMVS